MMIKDDVWRYSIILDKLNNEPKLAVERKYETNPWIISRWVKCAGETYGRGPVLNALPDDKNSQHGQEA